jgi:hypothetical protein
MNLPPRFKDRSLRRFIHFSENSALPLLLAAIVAAIVWAPRLTDALFVDEAGTFWLIQDGLVEGVQRALSKTGQSWFYTAILALWTSVFGMSEIALRLPSIAAALATCALVIRIGRDRGIASPGIAGILVALAPLMTFAATVARPYALGLFFSTLAIACLQSWTRRASTVSLYATVIATVCAIYCHVTFVALLLMLGVVLIEKRAYQGHLRPLLKASLAVLLGLSPTLLTLFYMSHDQISNVAIIHEPPSGLALLTHFLSTIMLLVLALVVAARITIFRRPPRLQSKPSTEDQKVAALQLPTVWSELRFGLALYLVPKMLTLGVALTVDPTLLVPRYSILSSVGEAYTAAVLLSTIWSRLWMMSLSAVAIVSMLLPYVIATPPDTAWRPIIERSHAITSRSSCTFFALVGFAESKRVELLTQEPTHSFIKSPLTYYRLEPAVLLPASTDSQKEQDYMAKMVYPKAASSTCNLILDWRIVDSAPTTMSGPQALANELARRGCSTSAPLSAGLVTLTEWHCR